MIEKSYYVIAAIPCPTCRKELLDYQNPEDPFLYCLNAEDKLTYKIPKETK